MNVRRTAILTAMLMLFSSVAGCLDNDETTDPTPDEDTVVDDDTVIGETAPEILGKAMVSTYHVEQLVSAVGGDHIDVEMMSTTVSYTHLTLPTSDLV